MMTLHMTPGELNPESPEVWGCPRLSEHGIGWMVDWFDARGNLQGATVAKGAVLEDCRRLSATEAAAMQKEVSRWLKLVRLG